MKQLEWDQAMEDFKIHAKNLLFPKTVLGTTWTP